MTLSDHPLTGVVVVGGAAVLAAAALAAQAWQSPAERAADATIASFAEQLDRQSWRFVFDPVSGPDVDSAELVGYVEAQHDYSRGIAGTTSLQPVSLPPTLTGTARTAVFQVTADHPGTERYLSPFDQPPSSTVRCYEVDLDRYGHDGPPRHVDCPAADS